MTLRFISEGEDSEISISSIELPAVSGQVGILPEHADFFALLTMGTVVYSSGGAVTKKDINGGVAHFENAKNSITIVF